MNILIIHTWGMGDLILFTPVLIALQKQNSNLKIDMLITNRASMFPLENSQLINKLYYTQNSLTGIIKISKQMKSEYDYGLFTTGVKQWKAALVLRFFNIKYRIGEYRKFKIPLAFKESYKYEYSRARTKSNELLFSRFLTDDIEYKPHYYLQKSDIDFAEDFLLNNRIDSSQKLFGIHPGCNKTSFYRRWPKEYFCEVIKKLMQESKITPILFIGPDELELGDFIQEKTGALVAKNLHLNQTAALLSKCDYFLNSDSGLGHIASCFKAELFIIFGPADERITAPNSEKLHILRSKIPPPPRKEWLKLTEPPKCLTGFYPEEVYSIIEKYI